MALGLDHNAAFVLWAFGITWLVLTAYVLYVRSRIGGLRRRLAATAPAGGAPARPVTQPGR